MHLFSKSFRHICIPSHPINAAHPINVPISSLSPVLLCGNSWKISSQAPSADILLRSDSRTFAVYGRLCLMRCFNASGFLGPSRCPQLYLIQILEEFKPLIFHFLSCIAPLLEFQNPRQRIGTGQPASSNLKASNPIRYRTSSRLVGSSLLNREQEETVRRARD